MRDQTHGRERGDTPLEGGGNQDTGAGDMARFAVAGGRSPLTKPDSTQFKFPNFHSTYGVLRRSFANR